MPDDDVPIYHTPLHPPIELASTTTSDDELVIYEPVPDNATKFILATTFHDTYDVR